MKWKVAALLLLLAAPISVAFAQTDGAPTDAPYVPVLEYKIKTYPTTDVPDWVRSALNNLTEAEYELGSNVADAAFFGELEGLAVYGYDKGQYAAARKFIAETDFTRQGIMAVGTSSKLRVNNKLDPDNVRKKIVTFFFNVLLGPARSGAINAQLDYRFRAIVTPIVAFRQGIMLARVNRPIGAPRDTTPLVASFAMWDEKIAFRVIAGGTYRHVAGTDYRTPVIGMIGTKAYRRTEYTFNFNRKDGEITIQNAEPIINCPVGGYVYIGESIQPMSTGVYEAGGQVGTDGTFLRLGVVMMNRFPRGTRVPKTQAYGLNGTLGYCFPIKPWLSLELGGNLACLYASSNDDLGGDWYGSPGATAAFNFNF